jgi:hypothetical protein
MNTDVAGGLAAKAAGCGPANAGSTPVRPPAESVAGGGWSVEGADRSNPSTRHAPPATPPAHRAVKVTVEVRPDEFPGMHRLLVRVLEADERGRLTEHTRDQVIPRDDFRGPLFDLLIDEARDEFKRRINGGGCR